MLKSLHNQEDPNSVLRYWVLPRAGRSEVMYFRRSTEGLVLTEKPEDVQDDHSANARMMSAIQAAFGPNEPIEYRPPLGPERTFYRCKKWAIKRKLLVMSNGRAYLPASGVKVNIN